MMKIFLALMLFISHYAYSRSNPSICDYIQYGKCYTVLKNQSRNGIGSYPSQTAGSFTNPSSVLIDRGLGIEILDPDTGTQVSLVSGTGRVGAAVSSNPNDDTFFGNFAVEDINTKRVRDLDNRMYDTDKLALAFAGNIFGKKSKFLRLDLGVMYRKHPDSDNEYFGGGATLGITKYFQVGYSEYKDEFYHDYRNESTFLVDVNGNRTPITYANDPLNISQFEYDVRNYVFSFRLKSFALDYSVIQTTFENGLEDSEVRITSLSFFWRRWMFTYATRREISYREHWDEDRQMFIPNSVEEPDFDGFLGVQYSLTKNIIVGIFSNYFLQNETSLGLTIFL
jgi:hypothetical protein